MPSLANITIKKNDGTTDIIWTGVAASSGDTVPAVWRSDTAASQQNARPTATMVAKPNGDKSARRVTVETRFPQAYTESTTGLVKVANVLPASFNIVVPSSMPQAQIDEAVSQTVNLLASTLFRDCLKAALSAS